MIHHSKGLGLELLLVEYETRKCKSRFSFISLECVDVKFWKVAQKISVGWVESLICFRIFGPLLRGEKIHRTIQRFFSTSSRCIKTTSVF